MTPEHTMLAPGLEISRVVAGLGDFADGGNDEAANRRMLGID